MLTKNCLVVILINLAIFGIIEVLSLPSFEVMTPARLLTHVGFLLNIVMLGVVLVPARKSL